MDILFSLDQLGDVAGQLWQRFQNKKVWALHGEMGAGKTTLVHAICNHLKVPSTISSPTFAIINEYTSPSNNSIFHIDLYRIKNEEEAIHTGIEDSILNGSLSFVEWPEKAPGILPEDSLHLYIEYVDEKTRKIYTR